MTNDTQLQRHLCVYNIARKLLKESNETIERLSGLKRSEYENNFSFKWNMNDIQQKFLDTNRINDTNWLYNYMLPETYKIYIYAAKMAQKKFPKDSRFFEFYAPDVMLDDQLKLWLLEINTNPRFVSISEWVNKWNFNTINDILEIQYAYLRSRFKRLHKFVKEILADYKKGLGPIDWNKREE